MTEEMHAIVKNHLTALTESTIISTEFQLQLFERDLVTESERHALSQEQCPNISRAGNLYVTYCKKWDITQWDKFMQVLDDTGNRGALEIFKNSTTRLKSELPAIENPFNFQEYQTAFLLQKEGGHIEGLLLSDEKRANKLRTKLRELIFQDDGRVTFCRDQGPDMKDKIIQTVQIVVGLMKEKKVWRNPNNHQQIMHIDRLVTRNPGTAAQKPVEPIFNVLQASESKIILLVNESGMGKSAEMMSLETQLRNHIPGERLIFRVKLSDIESRLPECTGLTDPMKVLQTLVPYLPKPDCNLYETKLFLLLDSADEVCPKHEESLLCAIKAINSLKNKHIVITSRPHPPSFIKKLSVLKVEAVYLCQLSIFDQLSFIQINLPGIEHEWEKLYNKFPASVKTIFGTPFALDLVCRVIRSDSSVLKRNINLKELFNKLVELINERHLVEKLNMVPGANATEIRKLSMAQRDFNSYYQVSRLEFDQVVNGDFLEDMCNYRDELLSFGLLVECNNTLKFRYECFAEYFYSSVNEEGNVCDRFHERIQHFLEANREQVSSGAKCFTLFWPFW